MVAQQAEAPPARGFLALIERLGNRLPDPATLFVIGALLVMVLSQIGEWRGWSVEKPTAVKEVVDGKEVIHRGSETLKAVGLLDADGLNWAISSMVRNFVNFPPLGIVLVGLMGIGVAERTGVFGAVLKAVAAVTPAQALTPMMVFLGAMSSLATDAGYVILPPIAATLYAAVGRSPLVGIAAVFAGIGGGFSANLFITSLDPLLSGFTDSAAKILDSEYHVAPTCNWYFMIISTFLLTFVGWGVSARFVEPRMTRMPADMGGPPAEGAAGFAGSNGLSPTEKYGLLVAGIALAGTLALVFAAVFIRGAPLNGKGASHPRWIEAIVPLLFFVFLVPGVAYGIATGTIRSDRDVAKLMGRTMADMGPYIVLAFFAAQFVEYFKYSNLGVMLAIKGGQALAAADLPPWALLVVFIAMVMCINILIASASAKFAFVAPVFVPMLMQVGISPELTQAAYRVGDSVTNIVTPLNSYLILILVVMQKYAPRAGVGTLVALMLPFSLVFWIVWTLMLVAWVQLGIPLGPEGPLWYGR